MEGEIRTYNEEADINSDGCVDGRDHAEACFVAEEDVYDIESFEYDKNGNRTNLVQNDNEYRYSCGERNRLETTHRKKKGETEESLFAAYEYDNCGNTTKRMIYKDGGTEEIVFEYDTMNRLIKTTGGMDVTEYFYDNAGNRFIKKGPGGTTVYLRHGQIAVALDIELPADTTEELGRVNRYVLSGDLLAGRVTDGNGVVEVMYEYRAFGEQLKRLDVSGEETDDTAKYSYGGKELDGGTELYYFNARYYDATIGRFINVDPVQDGGNWYVYARNNPLIITDSTGLNDDDSKMRGSDFQVDYTEGFVSIYQDDMYYVSKEMEGWIEGDNIGYFEWGDTFSEDAIIFTGENAMMEFSNSESTYNVWTPEGMQGNIYDITVPNNIQELRDFFAKSEEYRQQKEFYTYTGYGAFTVGTSIIGGGLAFAPDLISKAGSISVGVVSIVGGGICLGMANHYDALHDKTLLQYERKQEELLKTEKEYYNYVGGLVNTFRDIESQY